MARLILATAEGQQAIDLRPVNSLGRHPNNTIQLLDKIVSKEHCILEFRDGRFLLRDLGSLNGTYINGERVRGEAFLKHGDEIALGSTRARYDDGSGVPLPLPPVSPGAVQNPGPPQAGAGAGWGGPMVSQGAHPMTVPQQAVPYPSQGMPAAQPPMMPVPPGTGTPRPYQQPQPQPPYGGGYSSSVPQQPAAMAMQQSPPPPQHYQQPPPQQPQQPPYAGAPPPPAPVGPVARPPSLSGTRVDMLDAARAIGTQIAAQAKGFLPFDSVQDPKQLKLDYERLRVTWELTRDIGLERDLDKLVEKILMALFKFTRPTAASSCSGRTTARCSPAPPAAATAPTRPSR
jgi:adenylate cyclase